MNTYRVTPTLAEMKDASPFKLQEPRPQVQVVYLNPLLRAAHPMICSNQSVQARTSRSRHWWRRPARPKPLKKVNGFLVDGDGDTIMSDSSPSDTSSIPPDEEDEETTSRDAEPATKRTKYLCAGAEDDVGYYPETGPTPMKDVRYTKPEDTQTPLVKRVEEARPSEAGISMTHLRLDGALSRGGVMTVVVAGGDPHCQSRVTEVDEEGDAIMSFGD